MEGPGLGERHRVREGEAVRTERHPGFWTVRMACRGPHVLRGHWSPGLGLVSVFQSCRNKVPQARWFKPRMIYFTYLLGSSSRESGCRLGCALCEVSRGGACLGPRCFVASGSIPPIFAPMFSPSPYVFTWPSPYKDTGVGQEPTLPRYDLTLTNDIWSEPFPK